MKKKVLRILAVLLIFSVCTSLLPASVLAVSAEEPMEERTPTVADFLAGTATAEDIYGVLDPAIVPAAVDYDEAVEKNHVARCYEDEGTDLNKIIFLNVDGSKTMYTFDFPVKYVDDNGNIQDIRLEIADSAVNAGGFETAANDTVTTFSAQFTDGITLEGNDTEIRLIPILPSADLSMTTMSTANMAAPTATAQRIDADTVAYTYDAKTMVEYSLTYTGFKEDIVVSEYTGQTTYPFRLLTNGLALEEINGSFFLVDDEGNIEASIGDIIIFTADERNNAFGDIEPKTIVENQEYLLNIVVDADYLADPETTYPIRIDPTIEINYSNSGGNAIEDITITTNTEYTGSHTSLYVGRRSTEGVARALMRFPGLDLTELEGATVTSASVRVRDLMCEDTPLAVSCHVFSGNVWDADSATWADVSPDSYVLTALSTNTLSWSIGETFDPVHWYYFDITDAVRGWMNGNYTQSKGIIFKVSSSVENGSTIANRTFGSYNRASYRPSLIVTYSLPDSTINIREGGTSTLSAAGTTGTVTWASSDAAVATVNTAGLVTGVKAGYTTVTASVNGVVEKTFHVYVAVADGVYFIKNNNSGYYLSVKDSAISNSSNATQESKRTASPGRFSQLWKITYLSNGRYSIRPMHRLNMGLDVSGTTVDIWNATEIDSISDVPSYCQWTITYSTSGYIFRQGGLTSRAMAPSGLSTAVNATIAVGTPGALNSAYIWTLENVTSSIKNYIIFYDAINKELTLDPVRYIAPEETKTCEDLQLYASFISLHTNSQSITWTAQNAAAVKLDQSTGTVTGVIPSGFTTITASATYNGTVYSETYGLHVTAIPNGVYFIENKAGEKHAGVLGGSFVNGAAIEQWYYQDAFYQKWIFTHQGNGTYTIRVDTSGAAMYMGVAGDSASAGANIVLRSGAITDGMIWSIALAPGGRYKLIAKSSGSANIVLAVNASSVSQNGAPLQQLSYVNDTNYNDEWYICSQINIGMSTDDSVSGDCHAKRGAQACANEFYYKLFDEATSAPVTKTYHLNNDITTSASKDDFAVNGAISNDIDFMVYIGHGHAAHNGLGNHLHYDCGILETPHQIQNNVYTYCNPSGNVYTSEVNFGSSTSNLRWVWLYTCNFLTTGPYVSEDSLKAMMTGAHIVMGYASQAYLCTPNAELFAEYLRAGEPIIEAFFRAGREGEAPYAEDNNTQKVLYIPQAVQETIYSPRVHYQYDPSDVLIITRGIDDALN